MFTITVRNYFGVEIGRHVLAAPQFVGTSLTAVSTFNFTTPFPALGYHGVAEVQVDFHYADAGISPDELTFYSISIANVSSAVPLPLSLLRFSVGRENGGVRIHWTTAHELNVKEQVIEHSADGRRFLPIARFRGQSNAAAETTYTFFHAQPAGGRNYYRLKETGEDGQEKIFGVKSIDLAKSGLAIKTANPVNGPIFLKGLSPCLYDVRLLDMGGSSILHHRLSGSGDHAFFLPATVAKGMYLLTLSGGGEVLTQRVVVQ